VNLPRVAAGRVFVGADVERRLLTQVASFSAALQPACGAAYV